MAKIKELFNKIKINYELRSFLTSSFSFLVNIAFFTYNLVFGIMYNFVWNWSISIYYALLIFFRALIIFKEKSFVSKDTLLIKQKRLQLFKIICWFLLLMDVSLIAPISLMVLSKRKVSIGIIPAITFAFYTTYKITLAIINYSKKKSKLNTSIRALRIITLKDAIVSILTTQNTLIMVFGDSKSMITLTAFTSAIMLVIMVVITISIIIKSHKLTKKLDSEEIWLFSTSSFFILLN